MFAIFEIESNEDLINESVTVCTPLNSLVTQGDKMTAATADFSVMSNGEEFKFSEVEITQCAGGGRVPRMTGMVAIDRDEPFGFDTTVTKIEILERIPLKIRDAFSSRSST